MQIAALDSGPGAKAAAALADERLLRSSVGLVWLVTASTCVHPYYRSVGTAYLARLGLGPAWMFLACAAEMVLALRILAKPFGRALAILQIGAVAAFTALLAYVEPILLASPFGFLSKNLPFALVVWAAMRMARGDGAPAVHATLRAAAALPWLTEGLFPKLLFQQQVELAMAPAAGLTFASPHVLVATLGVLQLASFVLAIVLRGAPLRALLLGQAAALVVLPAVVGAIAPTLWVHPFGPFSKNLPILAATWIVARSLRP